jgi:glycerol-3-phosphate dehydrogenase (NAD(P)+)
MRTRSVALLGAGNWGTTLAHLVASRGHPTRLWTRDAARCREINEQHTNRRATAGLALAPAVRALTDLEECVRAADLILIVLPSQAFRGVCRALGSFLQPEQLVIHATKGLEAGTHRRMSEILREESCARQLGVLSGPNIAAEIAQGKLCGTVVASAFPRVIAMGREVLASPQMKVFSCGDVLGVELAGALKNVVAIAAGIADELHVGDNAKALLVARGLSELMQLSFAMGADPQTLVGLAGIGDLMVTCASPFSRNHRVGAAVARGEALGDALLRLGMVAEGVYASASAHALGRHYGIDMPVFERVEQVLREGLAPRTAIDELMALPAGHDPVRFRARSTLFPGAW